MPSAAEAVQIVQIAPHAPGGVADFVRGLRTAWQDAGVVSQVLPLCEDDVQRSPLAERLQRLSPASQGPIVVLLHFSGYGYAKRGLCGWLIDALRQARRDLAGRLHLVTFVHEIAASGPPWRSAFWTSAWQSRIAAELGRESDLLWTNTTHHADWLRRHVGTRRPVHLAPVFSTIGEGVHPGPWGERRPVLVVFGGAPTRQRALAALGRHASLLQRLQIESIIEVGTGAPSQVDASLPRPQFEGALGERQLAVLLGTSRFGLLDYPVIHLGKSTVYAAYASFGCVALNTSAEGATATLADGLAASVHFVACDRLTGDHGDQTLTAVAHAAHEWYRPHQRRAQAESFLRAFQTLCADAMPAAGRVAERWSRALS